MTLRRQEHLVALARQLTSQANTESKERFPSLAEVQPSRRSADLEPLGSKGEEHEHCQKIGGVCGDGIGRDCGREGLVKRGATADRKSKWRSGSWRETITHSANCVCSKPTKASRMWWS